MLVLALFDALHCLCVFFRFVLLSFVVDFVIYVLMCSSCMRFTFIVLSHYFVFFCFSFFFLLLFLFFFLLLAALCFSAHYVRIVLFQKHLFM